MKVQFDHEFQSSLFLYLDNHILYNGEGSGITQGMNFAYYSDTSDVGSIGGTDLAAFYAPQKQLVSDGLTSGENKVYLSNSTTVADGWYYQNVNSSELLVIDHYEGRIVMNPDYYGDPDLLNVSGNFATKDFNIYITNESEEQLFVENEFILADDNETYFESIKGLNLQRYVVPAVFISLNNTDNIPYGFGGEDDTREYPRIVCVADSNYGLDGILSLGRDIKQTSFPQIPFEDFPYGQFFHVKGNEYSYTGLKSDHPNSNYAYIENSTTSKLYDRSSNKIPKNLRIGFIDLEVSNIRYPRQ